MNLPLLIPLLITALAAACGWYVVHLFNASRDRENKRREKLTEFLIDAYRRIEKCTARELAPHNATDFESALADVQLFGSPELIELAQKVIEDMPRSNAANVDQLLGELRKVLRQELRLAPAPDKIVHLRITERKVPKV